MGIPSASLTLADGTEPTDSARARVAVVIEELEALFNRLETLAMHAETAGKAHRRWLPEVEQRLSMLGDAVVNTAGRIHAADSSAQSILSHTEQRLGEVTNTIASGLAESCAALERKATDTGKVLALIRLLGRQTHTLALNATIQASRSGDNGAGFAIIAGEVRRLADETIAGADEASDHLDLAHIVDDLQAFRDRAIAILHELSTEVTSLLGDQRRSFGEVDAQMSRVRGDAAVISEAVSLIGESSERASEKARWSATLAHGAADQLPDALTRHTEQVNFADLLALEGAEIDDAGDRLAAINRRGALRAACDPNALGLSFRPRPGVPLRGLDVEYVSAFASWLGVGCEFVEYDWDRCPELLETGRTRGEPVADLMWNGLTPNQAFARVAFSRTYTYVDFVLIRRTGDTQIDGLSALDGRVVGCVNDPAAFATLEQIGVRWSANRSVPGGCVTVGNLLSYSDTTRVEDAIVSGAVDVFAGDRSTFHWAATSDDSPWQGKLEILPTPISPRPWMYTVGVAARPTSLRLLHAINEFIDWFATQPERADIERRWQGAVTMGVTHYTDVDADLVGEAELIALTGLAGHEHLPTGRGGGSHPAAGSFGGNATTS